MLNVGLLGAGRIAGVHATAITTNPGSRLVAVSDINADAADILIFNCISEYLHHPNIIRKSVFNFNLFFKS